MDAIDPIMKHKMIQLSWVCLVGANRYHLRGFACQSWLLPLRNSPTLVEQINVVFVVFLQSHFDDVWAWHTRLDILLADALPVVHLHQPRVFIAADYIQLCVSIIVVLYLLDLELRKSHHVILNKLSKNGGFDFFAKNTHPLILELAFDVLAEQCQALGFLQQFLFKLQQLVDKSFDLVFVLNHEKAFVALLEPAE